MKTDGAYEAKTHLPRLLDEVATGHTITIAKNGVPVAMLIPARDTGRRPIREVITALETFRRGKTPRGLKVRQLIEEGRRY